MNYKTPAQSNIPFNACLAGYFKDFRDAKHYKIVTIQQKQDEKDLDNGEQSIPEPSRVPTAYLDSPLMTIARSWSCKAWQTKSGLMLIATSSDLPKYYRNE